MMAAGMTCLVLGKGKYTWSGSGHHFGLQKPVKICGQGCGETTLFGFGLQIKGSKSDGSVVIEDLTIREGTGEGLFANVGMHLIVRRCTVEQCKWNGLFAQGINVSCDDLQVVGCGLSGVFARESCTVKLSGENTRIEGNVTSGSSDRYGLATFFNSSSKFQIVAPLTKETISSNNGGGGNWNGYSIIEQVSV